MKIRTRWISESFTNLNENSKLSHDWKIVIDTDTSKTSEGRSTSFRIWCLGFVFVFSLFFWLQFDGFPLTSLFLFFLFFVDFYLFINIYLFIYYLNLFFSIFFHFFSFDFYSSMGARVHHQREQIVRGLQEDSFQHQLSARKARPSSTVTCASSHQCRRLHIVFVSLENT